MEFNIKVHSASKSTQLLAWSSILRFIVPAKALLAWSSILRFIVPAKAHNSWLGVQY
jgi:hypothetical protein